MEFKHLEHAWKLMVQDQGTIGPLPFPKWPNSAVHWADLKVADDYLGGLTKPMFEELVIGCQILPPVTEGRKLTTHRVLEAMFEEIDNAEV